MIIIYFQKILKKIKKIKNQIIKKLKKKGLLIGFVIDAITWIILLEYFVIYAIYLEMKINIIIQIWEIVLNILIYKYIIINMCLYILFIIILKFIVLLNIVEVYLKL